MNRSRPCRQINCEYDAVSVYPSADVIYCFPCHQSPKCQDPICTNDKYTYSFRRYSYCVDHLCGENNCNNKKINEFHCSMHDTILKEKMHREKEERESQEKLIKEIEIKKEEEKVKKEEEKKEEKIIKEEKKLAFQTCSQLGCHRYTDETSQISMSYCSEHKNTITCMNPNCTNLRCQRYSARYSYCNMHKCRNATCNSEKMNEFYCKIHAYIPKDDKDDKDTDDKDKKVKAEMMELQAKIDKGKEEATGAGEVKEVTDGKEKKESLKTPLEKEVVPQKCAQIGCNRISDETSLKYMSYCLEHQSTIKCNHTKHPACTGPRYQRDGVRYSYCNVHLCRELKCDAGKVNGFSCYDHLNDYDRRVFREKLAIEKEQKEKDEKVKAEMVDLQVKIDEGKEKATILTEANEEKTEAKEETEIKELDIIEEELLEIKTNGPFILLQKKSYFELCVICCRELNIADNLSKIANEKHHTELVGHIMDNVRHCPCSKALRESK